MCAHQPSPIESRPGAGVFPETRWSLILRAGTGGSPQSADALESLCRAYWPPLYAFVRRRGFSVHEAQDLVQEFLARLLERRDLDRVEPAKGRFRSFLLASMNHYLANEWERARRQKRGSGRPIFSLSQALEEGEPGLEAASDATPETEFERRWAETVIQRTLTRLREEWNRRYQPQHFDVLKTFLIEDRGSAPFAQTSHQLGVSESALKSVVHRLRRRYREVFYDEIAQTVGTPDEAEEEIRHLLSVLAR